MKRRWGMARNLDTKLSWKGLLLGVTMLMSGIASAQTVTIPAGQQQFMEIVTSFVEPYEAANNELLKSRQRKSRQAQLEAAFGSEIFSTWVDTLTQLGTTSDGDAYLVVRLSGSNIDIRTTNNGFSESLSKNKTLVKDGTDVFEQLIELGKDDIVVISGNFFPSNQDRYLEHSVTERGSMIAPDFLVSVSAISRYVP
jgi:hypothetical protein